jgi:hypothetical protein
VLRVAQSFLDWQNALFDAGVFAYLGVRCSMFNVHFFNNSSLEIIIKYSKSQMRLPCGVQANILYSTIRYDRGVENSDTCANRVNDAKGGY